MRSDWTYGEWSWRVVVGEAIKDNEGAVWRMVSMWSADDLEFWANDEQVGRRMMGWKLILDVKDRESGGSSVLHCTFMDKAREICSRSMTYMI